MTIHAFVSGPPGSGKTSLCKKVCGLLQLEHLSTGDLLREHIKLRTELGKVAKKCIAAKTLVPDDVVIDMIVDRIAKVTGSAGWILDGFPRTVEQAKALQKKGVSPNVVLVLEDLAKQVDSERFKTMLISGFDVIKHGRRGAPHTRTVLVLHVACGRLFWQKPDKKELKAKLDQSIAIADVIQVVQGMKTDVFKRSGDTAKTNRYLSLIADDRTLDIEVASEELCGEGNALFPPVKLPAPVKLSDSDMYLVHKMRVVSDRMTHLYPVSNAADAEQEVIHVTAPEVTSQKSFQHPMKLFIR
ncbi:hypothetical protein DYB32_002444 [Aphanomyces invadans]|uniref:Adenylate kinase active site lid domain-containing protein n=1 Tax=Aphanomyces invadans TaxID=157072 RepID=A0A3R6VEN0_9STRA|nr:hypothetical protein DYB32_002444 [Aphanomyces invadans]